MFKTRCYWDLGLLLVGVFVIVALGVTANDNQSASVAPSNAGGKKKGPVDHVFRTGQTVSYAPGEDGDLQAGVEWHVPRFIDNCDGTITDRLTMLMWTQDAAALGWLTWSQGLQAANDLVCADYDDWRMPNIREMGSLFDYGANYILPDGHPFINTGGYKWTSTTNPYNGFAWYWQIHRCQDYAKEEICGVWPVRGPVPSRK